MPVRFRGGFHHSPTIVDLVAHRFLSARGNPHKEFHSAAIELFERVRILEDVPTRPAVEILNYTHFDRLALVIAHFDFERFVEPSRRFQCAVAYLPDKAIEKSLTC